MLSDPIADMLTRVRNAYVAQKKTVLVPYSKLKEEIAKVLVKEGYLKKTKKQKTKSKNKEHNILVLDLVYQGKKPGIKEVLRVSKPSLRVYRSRKKLPKVLGGVGTAIVSTPKGIMTAKEAEKAGLGGEIVCQVW